MAIIDIEYKKILEYVLDGVDKPDPSRNIDTIHRSSYELKHDMLSGGIPCITTKKMFTRGVVGELLWFLSGSTNIKPLEDMGIKIWRDDAYNLMKRQGLNWSMDKFLSSLGVKVNENYVVGDIGPSYGKQFRDVKGIDQLYDMVKGLIDKPFSRRHRVNVWNPEAINDVALAWCHTDIDVCTMVNKNAIEFDLIWSQRSVDTFLGLPFNILSYALLGIIVSEMTGYRFNCLYGHLKNLHIYENHLESVNKQLCNSPYTYDNPKLLLSTNALQSLRSFRSNMSKENFDQIINNLKVSDFKIEGDSYPPIKANMVAPIN